jgi:predicted RNA-binding Zn-ribbon protein involved in translation (DUF1610 family)
MIKVKIENAYEDGHESSCEIEVPDVYLACPECGEEIWDKPHGHKLAKCWNSEGHETGMTLAFTTMEDEWIDGWWDAEVYPHTGDGHGADGLRGYHEATILTGPLAGQSMNWEG